MFFDRKKAQQQTFLCNNDGNCCDCVAFHQVYGGLPVCFVTQSTKTLSELRLEEELERLKLSASDAEEIKKEVAEPEKILAIVPPPATLEVVKPNSEPLHLKVVEDDDSIEEAAKEHLSFLLIEEDEQEEVSVPIELVDDFDDVQLRAERAEKEMELFKRLQALDEEKEKIEKERLELARIKKEEENQQEVQNKIELVKEGEEIPESKEPPLFIEVFFRCCSVYGKLYLNLDKTHYVGRCPKCKAKLTAPYGDSPRFGLRQ